MATGGSGGNGFNFGYLFNVTGYQVGGNGGNSTFGGGAVGKGAVAPTGTNISIAGGAGTLYGGGASGALNYRSNSGTASAAAGAIGASGVIIITEYK
jgi:hypothetical protein